MESKGRTIEVHTAEGIITTYERLNNIISSLPPSFYQCHKSYIVNMHQIQRFKSSEIQLKNGEIVTVSRSKYNETKKAYFEFIGKTF
jgi:DNA-binding LytR/AlgR family response regulator